MSLLNENDKGQFEPATGTDIKQFLDESPALKQFIVSELRKELVAAEGWDASQGTNPDTCLHFIAKSLSGLDVCFSCSSTLGPEFWAEFIWDWDGTYECWVRRSVRESRRELSKRRHPLLGMRDSRHIKVFREEFPAIFRFNGRLFIESFDIEQDVDQFVEVSPERAEYWLNNNLSSSDSDAAIKELRRKLSGN